MPMSGMRNAQYLAFVFERDRNRILIIRTPNISGRKAMAIILVRTKTVTAIVRLTN